MCGDGGELGTGVTPGGFRGAGAADAGECERDACGAAAGVAFRGVLSNVRGLRPGRELAALVMREWRGKKLYLKKERLEWGVC